MRTALFAVALAALASLLIGCSPVAWAPRETPQVSSISAGERVTLELRDGALVTGTVASVRDLPDAEYAVYYADRRAGGELPAIGDVVAFTTALDANKVWTGTLSGFDESHLLVTLPGANAPEKVYFSSVTSITAHDGRAIRRMELRGLYLNGQIPLRSSVVLTAEAGERQVPLNEIARIGVTPAAAPGAALTWLGASDVRWTRN